MADKDKSEVTDETAKGEEAVLRSVVYESGLMETYASNWPWHSPREVKEGYVAFHASQIFA